MLEIIYKPIFIRQYKKLPPALKEEAKEKIELFQKEPEHVFLKTHKLNGVLKGRWAFSVNYEYRIVFLYLSKREVALLSIGNHDVYKE